MILAYSDNSASVGRVSGSTLFAVISLNMSWKKSPNKFLLSHHPATLSSLVVAVTHSLSRSVCQAVGYDSQQPFVVFLYVFHLFSLLSTLSPVFELPKEKETWPVHAVVGCRTLHTVCLAAFLSDC